MSIPDLLSVLGRGQNFIIVELWAIGYLARLLPETGGKFSVPNRCIPAIVCVASFLLCFMLITPFKDAFLAAPLFAVVAIISYEPLIKRLEQRIEKFVKSLLDKLFGPEDPPSPPLP